MGLAAGLLLLSCSRNTGRDPHPSNATTELPRTHQKNAITGQPAPDMSRLSLGEHCGEECCPQGYLHIAGTPANDEISAPSNEYTCITGDFGDDSLQASNRGAYLAGGPGNDTLIGGPERDTLVGDDGDDTLRGGAGGDHLDGGYGNDQLYGEAGNDLLLGGPGRDRLEGGPGSDALEGGPGNDELFGGDDDDYLSGGLDDDYLDGGAGHDVLFGGGGNDVLAGGEGDDYLHGGGGNDTLRGGPGNDRLVGGPGVDLIYGEDGDDTIVIQHACELESGDLIDGGPGHDVLISPLSEPELRALGVRLVSIEEVRITGSAGERVCRTHAPNSRPVEVSGTISAKAAVWFDPGRDEWFEPDGALHEDAQLWTRWTMRLDAVYDAPRGLEPSSEIAVLTPGGSTRARDGTGITVDGCCGPTPTLGARYRLGLRRVSDATGATVGYRLETYPSHALQGMFLPLPPAGPIPLSLERPGRQNPSAQCPLPGGKFGLYDEAIQWANIDGRWAQNHEQCSDPAKNDCKIALVSPVFDNNTNDPPDGCDFGRKFSSAIWSGVKKWSRLGNASYSWGLLVPNALPTLATCEAHKKDGQSCIALDIPNPDLGGAPKQPELPDELDGQTKRWLSGITGPGGVEVIEEADFVIRKSANFNNTCITAKDPYNISIESVGGHEFGHVMGYLHPACWGTLMSQPLRDGDLTEYDKMRARIIYPAYADGTVFPNNVHIAP
jgi:hypothetical protein